MGATQGTSGYGTLLKIGDGATPTEAFTTVAEVKSISGPNMSTETIDATHMESPSGFREILPSFKSGGEISVDVNFLPGDSQHQGIISDFENRTLRNFQIVWPDTGSTTWQVSSYVTSFSPNASIDDILSASITLMISGAPNFSA